jgi:hypothetical protein
MKQTINDTKVPCVTDEGREAFYKAKSTLTAYHKWQEENK